ncbi:MAG: hypothetical protein GYA17_18475 [Chloroflexi bacterium]|nr:hypothetical protein [Chloroflexota bacterium]
MNYTSFVDDLIYRITEYNNSFKTPEQESRYPQAQRETWAPVERRKALTQHSLGCDDAECIRLLGACGYDDEPVSSQTASTVRKWFETTNGHVFPPQTDVLRLAIFFCLDIYETLHWVLKADFEKYLFEHDPEWSYQCGKAYIEILSQYQSDSSQSSFEAVVKDYRKQLDVDALYRLCEEHWRVASSAGYTRQSFVTLVDDFFLEKLLGCENHNQKIQKFAEYQQELVKQARYGSPQEQDLLWRSRSVWQNLLDYLDDLFVEIENIRLKNAETEQEYLLLFGDGILAQVELETEITLFEMRNDLRRKQPELSTAEIDEKVHKAQEDLRRQIDDLKLKKALADHQQACLASWKEFGAPMSRGALNDERERCKREIRAIRKLVHPDVLMHNPVYQSLSESQKKELEEILLDALKISPFELGYPPNFAYHDMRSYEGLRQVRKRVETILKLSQIKIDLEYQIQGETITQQIDWLDREISRLENQVNAAKGQLTAMLTAPEVQAKKTLMSDADKQVVFKKQMQERIAYLTSKRDRLSLEWDHLQKLAEEGAHG